MQTLIPRLSRRLRDHHNRAGRALLGAEPAPFAVELQTLEFTSIISLLLRAQVVWGRVLTAPGVISAFRVSALRDVGLFDPSMATEDIDVSWRLQRRLYDIRYEPRALVDMTVPATVRSTLPALLTRQKSVARWASVRAPTPAQAGLPSGLIPAPRSSPEQVTGGRSTLG